MIVTAAGVAFLQEVNVRFAAVIPARSLAAIGRLYPFGADRLTASGRFIRGKRVA